MTFTEFIFEAVIAVAGAGGLVAAFLLYRTSRYTAALGLAIAALAIYFSGQAVLTSGAATLAAILVMAGQWVGQWRQWIYRSFFLIFKIIWIGVGLNAIYNIGTIFWGWPGLEVATPTWFFAEGVFAIIILIGVYIGKSLGPGIGALLKTGEPPAAHLFGRIAAAGGVSFVSWYAWSMARKGLLEPWSMTDLIAVWLGGIVIVLGLVILLETLRRTINARHLGRT